MGMKKQHHWKRLLEILIYAVDWTNRCGGNTISLILAGTSTGLLPMRIIQNATQKILLLLLPQRRIWQMCSFLWAVNIWCWIKIIKWRKRTLEGDDLDRAMEVRNIREDKFKPQQTVFVCDPQKWICSAAILHRFTVYKWWLYEHFPSPEILLYIFYSNQLYCSMRDIDSEVCKNMRTQLSPLFEATRQVAEQNLDFEVGTFKNQRIWGRTLFFCKHER